MDKPLFSQTFFGGVAVALVAGLSLWIITNSAGMCRRRPTGERSVAVTTGTSQAATARNAGDGTGTAAQGGANNLTTAPATKTPGLTGSQAASEAESPCKVADMPNGVLQQPPSGDDLMLSLHDKPNVFDGLIIAESAAKHRRIVVDAQMIPKTIGTVGVLIGPTTKIHNRCNPGDKSLLKCGKYVRVSLPGGYDTLNWGFWASDIWVIAENEIGQTVKCP